MKKMGRSSRSKAIFLEELRIRLCFKDEIEENNLFLAGSLAYLFGVLYALLAQAVELYLGIILILTAVMIVWYFRDKRREIRRRYEKRIESVMLH